MGPAAPSGDIWCTRPPLALLVSQLFTHEQGCPEGKKKRKSFVTPSETNVHGTPSASWSFMDLLYFKGWQLAVSGWRLVVGGGWRWAVGSWRLVAPGGLSLGAILNKKKKIWLLKDSPAPQGLCERKKCFQSGVPSSRTPVQSHRLLIWCSLPNSTRSLVEENVSIRRFHVPLVPLPS